MTASTDNPQSAAIASKESRDAFARLTQFGWNGGLAIILLGLTLSFFLAGYFVIYWRIMLQKSPVGSVLGNDQALQ